METDLREASAGGRAIFIARGQAQYDFRTHFGENDIFLNGWGGGKSYTGGDKATDRATRNTGNGILGAQHYRHLEHVMVPKLRERSEARGLRPKWLKTDKVFLFRALPRNNQFGCQFAFGLSADAPEAIRAVEGTWGWFDEPGAYSSSDTDAERDALLQFAGRVRGGDVAQGRDWTGTNEGDGTGFYKMQSDARSGVRDDVAVFRGESRDNIAHLGEAWFRHVEATVPFEMHDQYLRGGVGSLNQELAAWEWRQSMIREDPLPLAAYVNGSVPLISCWDFGISPMAMSVAQQSHEGGHVHWIDEVVIKLRGNTEDATRIFCERFRPLHPGPVLVFGDATGKAGSAQSKIDNYVQMFQIMEEYWPEPGAIISMVPPSNPPIETRLITANAAIKSGMATVSRRCKNLLRDLGGGRLIQGTAGKKECQKNGYSHSWVGMSYTLYQLFPLRARPDIGAGADGILESRRGRSPINPGSLPSARVNPIAARKRDV